MKNVFKYIVLTLFAAVSIGCGGPRRVIPDDRLQQIVREMFITNAYVAIEDVSADSLDVYTPILERYGYTKEDFFYTLGDFQKRKSARFSYIINNTITALEAEADDYESKVRNLNRIDSMALARSSREVYFNPKIEVKRFRDTASLRIRIPVREGKYEISYAYRIDSLDLNNRLQSTFILDLPDGSHSYYYRATLQRDGRHEYKGNVETTDRNDTLAVWLADYTRREDRPHIRFDSIRIVHYPPVEVALARMDSLLMFYPEMIYSDSIRQYVLRDVEPPLAE